MRLSNGFVIDKEKTFGELKFTAVRDVFLQVVGRQARISGSLPFDSFGGERDFPFLIPLPPYDFFILRRL